MCTHTHTHMHTQRQLVLIMRRGDAGEGQLWCTPPQHTHTHTHIPLSYPSYAYSCTRVPPCGRAQLAHQLCPAVSYPECALCADMSVCVCVPSRAGGFLLYLMSGTVDVLVHWNRPGAPNAREGGGKGGAGGEGEFPDEGGEGVSPLMDEESYTHRTQLARAASKACDFVTSLQNAAGE